MAEQFKRRGFDITHEFHIPGAGHVDLAAERPGERVAIEVETGKSDIDANLKKLRGAGFDRVVFFATNPAAILKCRRTAQKRLIDRDSDVEINTWLDVS